MAFYSCRVPLVYSHREPALPAARNLQVRGWKRLLAIYDKEPDLLVLYLLERIAMLFYGIFTRRRAFNLLLSSCPLRRFFARAAFTCSALI